MKSMDEVLDHIEKGIASADWSYIHRVHETLQRLQRQSKLRAAENAEAETDDEVADDQSADPATPKPKRRKPGAEQSASA